MFSCVCNRPSKDTILNRHQNQYRVKGCCHYTSIGKTATQPQSPTYPVWGLIVQCFGHKEATSGRLDAKLVQWCVASNNQVVQSPPVSWKHQSHSPITGLTVHEAVTKANSVSGKATDLKPQYMYQLKTTRCKKGDANRQLETKVHILIKDDKRHRSTKTFLEFVFLHQLFLVLFCLSFFFVSVHYFIFPARNPIPFPLYGKTITDSFWFQLNLQ